MTAAEALHAQPHEPRCAGVVLWTGVPCVRGAGHVGGHVGCLGSFADDGHKEGGHG